MASNATDVLTIQYNATNVLDLQDASHNLTNDTAQDAFPTIATALPNIVKTMEPVLANSYLQSSLNFFFFGTVLETGRRLWQFLMDKFTGGQSFPHPFLVCSFRSPALVPFFLRLRIDRHIRLIRSRLRMVLLISQ